MAKSMSRLRRMLLGLVAAVLLVATWASVGQTEKAEAGNFCTYVFVQPYGQAGDRCAATWGGPLYGVTVESFEHSGCVATTNAGGALNSSWVCSAGPNSFNWQFYGNDGVYRRAIIRNNTTGATNHISGSWTCYC